MSPLVWHTARYDNLIKRIARTELEFKPDVRVLVVAHPSYHGKNLFGFSLYSFTAIAVVELKGMRVSSQRMPRLLPAVVSHRFVWF